MRCEFVRVKTRREAKLATPWAATWIKADGGYWAFESTADADRWRRQQ